VRENKGISNKIICLKGSFSVPCKFARISSFLAKDSVQRVSEPWIKMDKLGFNQIK
jgi:hypothetical protein